MLGIVMRRLLTNRSFEGLVACSGGFLWQGENQAWKSHRPGKHGTVEAESVFRSKRRHRPFPWLVAKRNTQQFLGLETELISFEEFAFGTDQKLFGSFCSTKSTIR
jgi:hypothetical protein